MLLWRGPSKMNNVTVLSFLSNLRLDVGRLSAEDEFIDSIQKFHPSHFSQLPSYQKNQLIQIFYNSLPLRWKEDVLSGYPSQDPDDEWVVDVWPENGDINPVYFNVQDWLAETLHDIVAAYYDGLQVEFWEDRGVRLDAN